MEKEFGIEVDAEELSIRTEIVFVPDPGNGLKDLFYFVTEPRGAVKAVTNDLGGDFEIISPKPTRSSAPFLATEVLILGWLQGFLAPYRSGD